MFNVMTQTISHMSVHCTRSTAYMKLNNRVNYRKVFWILLKAESGTLTVSQLGTLITVFTRACHCIQIRGSRISTTVSYYFYIHLNIILHTCVCLPSGLFRSQFRTKILCAYLSSNICAICPALL